MDNQAGYATSNRDVRCRARYAITSILGDVAEDDGQTLLSRSTPYELQSVNLVLMSVEFFENCPVRVFISYVRRESESYQDLVTRLDASSNVDFHVLSDRALRPGDLVAEKLSEWIGEAEIILFLVSPALLDSPSARIEINAALRRWRQGDAIVVPVLLTWVSLGQTELGQFHALPPDLRPVDTWESPTAAFNAVVSALEELVLSNQRSSPGRHGFLSRDVGFQNVWFIFSAYFLLSSLAFIGWYATHPVVQDIADVRRSTSLFLSNSIVVGFTAMSLIQIARRIFRIRGAYHREILARWLREQVTCPQNSPR